MSKPADQLLDHNYDGIQEYDNPLPGWWSAIFVVCILFSIGYPFYYHFGSGPLVSDEYAADAQAQQELLGQNSGPELTDEALVALSQDPAVVSAGQALFTAKCLACHGAQGQGLVGPNLCDAYWLHGGRPTQIYTTIVEGVPAKGMIPWGTQLKPDELQAVAGFVLTLQGTDPPNPKAPEGDKLE